MVLLTVLAAKMMVGEVEVKERPRPSPDYLMQLLNEKKLMTSLPNLCGIFTHLERLLDEGKWRCGAMRERRQGGKWGKSVTTAQSGPGTTSLGDPAARRQGKPATVAGFGALVTSRGSS